MLVLLTLSNLKYCIVMASSGSMFTKSRKNPPRSSKCISGGKMCSYVVRIRSKHHKTIRLHKE